MKKEEAEWPNIYIAFDMEHYRIGGYTIHPVVGPVLEWRGVNELRNEEEMKEIIRQMVAKLLSVVNIVKEVK